MRCVWFSEQAVISSLNSINQFVIKGRHGVLFEVQTEYVNINERLDICGLEQLQFLGTLYGTAFVSVPSVRKLKYSAWNGLNFI
jgi:hypothetical protein